MRRACLAFFARVTFAFFPPRHKTPGPGAQNNSDCNSPEENGCKGIQVSQAVKAERIRELKEQVDSLQKVIRQVSITKKKIYIYQLPFGAKMYYT